MALEVELQHYETIKGELLRHHLGKSALIIGAELLGVYDDDAEAYRMGLAQRGNVPMLIKRILPEEVAERIPALSLGLIRADL